MTRPLSRSRPARTVTIGDPLDRVDECDVYGWGHDLTLEDLETEPVPAGCHSCFLTTPRGRGERCRTCPDREQDRNADDPDAVLGC